MKTLFTAVDIVSYKRLCLLYKEVGLVLVSCNSAAIAFTSSLLSNLVIGLFKIFSVLISELVWILANWYVDPYIMLPKNAQILGAIQKVRTLLMEERRGGTKNVQKSTREGELPRVYVSLYLFKGVFSHLNCLFLFFTSLMGKWKL